MILIILVVACNAQDEQNAAGLKLKANNLLEQQIENQKAQAEYYREQVTKLRKPNGNSFWKDIINSNIVILLIGFIFTTVVGGIISSRLQKKLLETTNAVGFVPKKI